MDKKELFRAIHCLFGCPVGTHDNGLELLLEEWETSELHEKNRIVERLKAKVRKLEEKKCKE